MLSPNFEDFVRLAGTGDLVPVWREFLFDADTAVTAYAKLARQGPTGTGPDVAGRRGGANAPTSTRNPHLRSADTARSTGGSDSPWDAAQTRFGFLLESVEGGEKWARYTFLGTAPREAWRLEAGGQVSRWTPDGGWSEPTSTADPLGDLDRLLCSRAPVAVPGLPRFFGGAVGYLGYDVVRYIEPEALGYAAAGPERRPRLPDAPPTSTRRSTPLRSATAAAPTERSRSGAPDAPPDEIGRAHV